MSTSRGQASSLASSRSLLIASSLCLCVIAWGAFAFGSVYPWAYWPLAIGSQLCGFSGWLASREGTLGARGLTLALAGVAIAVLAQLVPVPLNIHALLSPGAAALLPNLDFSYGAGLVEYRSLSVVPAATGTALALYSSFAILLLGMTRVLGLGRIRHLAEGLAVVGSLVALSGIVQLPFHSTKIYGLWQPETGGSPVGPFVNRNHFAGWMLMVLPIVLALLCDGLDRSMRGLKPGWRYRLLWLSSPEANRLILIAVGAGVIALSLVLTMSRSGITALAVSLLLTTWFIARGIHGRPRQAAGAAYLVILALTVVAWIGADTIVGRFSETDWSEFNSRSGAWKDAWRVAGLFPLTGAGINTYDTLATHYQQHDLLRRFGEAHNDYLQLAAEGGLLVGIPAFICLVLFVREIRVRMHDEPGTTSWWLRRGAVTALVAIALQEAVDFSLQMPGNAALFAVICAIAIHRPPVRWRPSLQRPHVIRREGSFAESV